MQKRAGAGPTSAENTGHIQSPGALKALSSELAARSQELGNLRAGFGNLDIAVKWQWCPITDVLGFRS